MTPDPPMTVVLPDADRSATVMEEAGPTHRVYGIRHHGPGSARSLLAAFEEWQPDAVLIEGPADADPLLRWVLADGMEPPVSLLAYAPDRPRLAAFWPFARFSPEWQAMTWAVAHNVEVGFCDLPAATVLAPRARTLLDDPDDPDDPDDADGEDAEDRDLRPGVRESPVVHDPLGALAAAAGYDDAERWWDDVVEGRLDGSSPFELITEAMAELRPEVLHQTPGSAGLREQQREAHMRIRLRAALKAGRQRVAVVCGAWHAPALVAPLPPASHDARLLRGIAKRKVALTWVPWTHERLASTSGYGAGVASPGWYHHLWTAPDQPIVRWLTSVAHALRRRDLAVSSAHVIEAVRLAETLATLRGRPLAGLAEVTDATRAVLCNGDEVALRYVTDQLVVGQTLGSVSPDVPTVPLEADLTATCRTLRLKRVTAPTRHDLDLRRSIDQGRSRLFHRLRLLGLDWAVPTESDVQAQGTFRETWKTLWHPEYAVAVVEAAVWGTTVESAAGACAVSIAAQGTLLELAEATERCLLAQLPDALDALLAALADRTALDADVVHLMDALPALARAQRYGDVRRTDTTVLREVAEVMALRICTGLPRAVAGIDDETAGELRRRVDRVTASIGLLHESAPPGADDLRERWLSALRVLVDRPDIPGVLLGRIVRLLVDGGRLDDAALRLGRALSPGVPADTKAGWVDGFFADGALLLIHDPELRGLLDGWIAGLGEKEFVALLPLVRRTFGTFSPTERRTLAERVARADDAEPSAPDEVDLARAAPALATVTLILGGGR